MARLLSVFKESSKTHFPYWLRIFHNVPALKLFKHFPILWDYLGGLQVHTITNSTVMSILFINRPAHFSPLLLSVSFRFVVFLSNLRELPYSHPAHRFLSLYRPSSLESAVPDLTLGCLLLHITSSTA